LIKTKNGKNKSIEVLRRVNDAVMVVERGRGELNDNEVVSRLFHWGEGVKDILNYII